jgi:hypothetical protein
MRSIAQVSHEDFPIFAEGMGQPNQPSHPQGQVLPLDMRRAGRAGVRITEHRHLSAPDAFSGEIRIFGQQRNNIALPVCG